MSEKEHIEQEAAALEGGSENNRTEPEMGVYVRIEDVMMPQEDLVETFAKAAAKEQDEAIAGEICQVLEKYGIEITPEVLLDKVQELDDRSNKRYRDGYLAGYRKALEDQERSEEGNGGVNDGKAD